jgi:hypothetical protein
MKKILVILAAAMMATTGAFAKQECKEDRAKFCASVEKGNHQAMHQCMKSHEGELSASCKSHRDTIREKGKGLKKACKADYKKLCKSVKSGEGRIIKCLRENEAQLSADCKSALTSAIPEK